MNLTYMDLAILIRDNPNLATQNISVWDPDTQECRTVSNAYINNSDSPTSDILDPEHLVLILGE